jgi:hypothetical protein
MKGTLQAVRPNIILPVTLSERVRREAFIATGADPQRRQTLQIDNLAELGRPLRERIVDILDQVRIQTEEDVPPGPPTADFPVATAYASLIRGASDWAVCKSPDDATEIRTIFSAGEGRTLALRELVAATHGDEAVNALLTGKPLVDALDERAMLSAEDVVLAYEQALKLSEAFAETMESCHVGAPGFLESIQVTDEFLFIEAPVQGGEEDLDPVGLVRGSDPEAFANARNICESVVALSRSAQEQFAHDVCKTMRNLSPTGYERDRLSDADVVSLALRHAAVAVRRGEDERRARACARERYEHERARWIVEHGSQRLRLAAERGYKHDVLYREERLATELPGFLTGLPKRSEVREIINPSEQALTLETETTERLAALGAQGTKVKLVYVRIGSGDDTELDDGEYVQVTGYLGQHEVWRSVDAVADDEIPF